MSLTRWLRRAASSHKTRKPVSRRLSFETLEARDNPSGGLLDPSFGSNGLVLLPSSTSQIVEQTVVQPDGKIDAVGDVYGKPRKGTQATYQVSVTRLNADGTLDQTFGTNGTVNLPVGTDSEGYAIALQPDGKILVGAHATYVDKKVSGSEYAIGRLNPNGTLDTSFGNSQGWWLAHPTNNGEEITKLAVAPNGTTFSIYGGGDTAAGFAVVKLDANGHPDPTYGTNGISVQHVGTSTNTTIGFTVASTGEAFVLSGGYLVAFNPTGQLDTNFNGTGYTPPSAPGSFFAVALQGQNILVAGHLVNVSQGMLARYTMTGTLDPTFGTGGTYLTPLTLASRVYFRGIAVESDGSIAVVGYTGYTDANNQNHSSLLVGHLSADGVADTTFGTDGTGFAIYPEFNEKYDLWLVSISLDASGDFVISGETIANGPQQGFVLRFTHP
jgi:uncharacterized delta-60 repeat protein